MAPLFASGSERHDLKAPEAPEVALVVRDQPPHSRLVESGGQQDVQQAFQPGGMALPERVDPFHPRELAQVAIPTGSEPESADSHRARALSCHGEASSCA